MAVLNGFLDIVRTIRVNDVIDMAIMAFIFYKVLYFLARTGTGRVLKGILFLVVVLLLARALDLYMVNYIFGKTFELGILALLVIFQPEVRSLLEKVGGITKYISTRSSPREVENAIGQVVLACRDLSATKTGALIVFERDNTLEEPVKTGTLIHADVKAELLKNIFYPNTPLHDGAVIIRGGRIEAASCMLPLTTQTHLSRELGMRHRAGIGMSENSDAVVVVVSEETGSISVAVEGILKRHLTEETFERILRNELLTDSEENQPKLKTLAQNMFMKGRNDGKN
ncbi:MAG: diadenylate cyclase CdaA [Oscillospiraceae bacterium]|nr:diadenylate cyclase CdaA [Oscillospiraceae bacterium]